MIRLAEVAAAFAADLEAHYADRLLPEQRNALSAILHCRTEACGTAAIHCHDCRSEASFPLSCGHRACPQCQNEAVEQWLARQRAKLLPVDYYLIPFTLPFQLRALVYSNQRQADDLLIKLAWQTLSEFGLNDKTLQGRLGATAVLHTHSRALDFHPHVHIVVPAGAIDPVSNRWRTKQGKFLFPEKALAKVFRGKWFQAMKEQAWTVKVDLPREWVVDCEWVGNGEKALLYLGRYLYRGVLAEKNILACEDGEVTFRYTENSGATQTRTLPGADFLWRVLQHVLPKGFRRSRDYGFLHGNCKRLIQRLHLLLRVCLPQPQEKPPWCCKQCGSVLITLTVIPYPRNRKPPDRPAQRSWRCRCNRPRQHPPYRSGKRAPRGLCGRKTVISPKTPAKRTRSKGSPPAKRALTPSALSAADARGRPRKTYLLLYRSGSSSPGSSNYKDKSWFAALTRLVLYVIRQPFILKATNLERAPLELCSVAQPAQCLSRATIFA